MRLASSLFLMMTSEAVSNMVSLVGGTSLMISGVLCRLVRVGGGVLFSRSNYC